MPAVNPRVQVTLTSPQHDLLRRLAALQKRSMSAVLSELFETVYPALERVAVVLQAAARAQESQRQGLIESTKQAERDMRPHVAAAMGQMDLLAQEFELAAGPHASAVPEARAARRRTPGPVTRGSARTVKSRRTRGTTPRKRPKSAKRRPGR